jgi:hypothetical protein
MSTGVPKRAALLQNGEKHKVTIHGAPHGQKAYIKWDVAWFLKGYMTVYSVRKGHVVVQLVEALHY